VDIRTRDVFATMRPDLLLVEERLEKAARIDYPVVTDLILGLVRAGGKRLRPLVLLLAGRAYGNDRDNLVDCRGRC
jgi:geranylgeranyl pyrophosphate synthase